ncbi:MAG: hypothetical protein K8R56_08930 [Candidatus Eisenbacteria bacterium]|nr:hypothetical protein [Candidatus Eisenbacteria bacterium]
MDHKPDDRFLHEQRRAPAPGYARSLRERLRQTEDAPPQSFRWQPLLAAAAAVAVGVMLFTVPAVRVAAQNALDLFRVRTFAAVEIDPERMKKLEGLKDDDSGSMQLFERDASMQEPGKPVEYPSADLAASAAGLPGLRKPGTVPEGMQFQTAIVTGTGEARLTIRTEKLQHVLDALGITDVRVPTQMDGQKLTVRMPHSVIQKYKGKKHELTLIEANSPEVSLPPGADMRTMGEIGLRVLGLDAKEARKLADSIDWRSTLLVPVPMNAATFRQVDVNGHRGLFIRTNRETGKDGEVTKRGGAMVMWTEGERVLAVQGDVSDQDVLEVAQSMR